MSMLFRLYTNVKHKKEKTNDQMGVLFSNIIKSGRLSIENKNDHTCFMVFINQTKYMAMENTIYKIIIIINN